METQIDRLTNLIKDLLDVTKITEGKLELKHVEFDMNELINEVVEDIKLITKRHTIVKRLQEAKRMMGYREKISQVLVNLVSNAIKYSPNADKIIIESTATSEGITVCMQDFGILGLQKKCKRIYLNAFSV